MALSSLSAARALTCCLQHPASETPHTPKAVRLTSDLFAQLPLTLGGVRRVCPAETVLPNAVRMPFCLSIGQWFAHTIEVPLQSPKLSQTQSDGSPWRPSASSLQGEALLGYLNKNSSHSHSRNPYFSQPDLALISYVFLVLTL